MKIIEDRLHEIRDCFANGDEHLGSRRLIDAVMDTSDLQIYRTMLETIEDAELKGKTDHQKLDNLLNTLSGFKYHLKTKREEVLLNVDGLKKQYAGSRFAISPVSFKLHYSQVIGLVGENGNGKTTLLRMLCKDLEADGGSAVYAAEKDSRTLYDLRSKLIYIPQRVPRWFGSLMDNLHFTLSSHGVKGEENVLRAELIIARLGLRPYKDLGWNRISSGYRTRFELARSLLRNPELMLLDEPLSNLDIISQQTILKDLKLMSESVSRPFGIVLSSQQLYEVEKISDMVIFLKNGEPKYQFKDQPIESEIQEIVFELETDESREILLKTFEGSGLNRIQFNGGVYMLHFESNVDRNEVFKRIAQHNLPVRYIRDITYSSRRFFIQ